MATLTQDIYNIKNIAARGKTAVTDTLSESQVAHWIQYYRALAIEQMFVSRDRIPQMMFQKTGCLDLTEIDMAECPCEDIMWGCTVKKVDIPKVVDLAGLPALGISLVDGLTHIDLVNASAMLSARHAKWTGNQPKAYIDRSVEEGMMSLYIGYADGDLEFIKVRGVFDDPTKVVTQVGSPGNCVPRYFDMDTDDYPMTGQVRSSVYRLIFERELVLTLQSVEDILNNNRGDASLISVKQALAQIGLYGQRNNTGRNRTGTTRAQNLE